MVIPEQYQATVVVRIPGQRGYSYFHEKTGDWRVVMIRVRTTINAVMRTVPEAELVRVVITPEDEV